jgi:hypothetical protein
MPIRINLLAEALEIEEQRRRDPVKRAIYVACGVVGVFLVWAASKQVLILAEKSRLNDLESQIAQTSTEFDEVSTNQQKLKEVDGKLASLSALATNRLLNGSVLNALQKAAVKDIQILRFKVDQNYIATPAEKSKVNETTGSKTPGKPATVNEQIAFSIEARDTSLRPGEEVLNKWRQSLGDAPFFRDMLGKTNEFRLTLRGAPQIPPGAQRPVVTFTLEARVPDHVR